MTRSLYYPPADRTSQWYSGGTYGGSTMAKVNAGVLHTTEGPGGWPAYSSGAVAPTLTMLPVMAEKRCIWRQHFKLNESGRALANKIGGVQTNTLNVVQIEMVGTSIAQSEAGKVDANWRAAFMGKRENVDYVYWGDPPDWALQSIADLALFMRDDWGVPLQTSVPFVSAVNGNDNQRMSFDAWENFNGWCGHEHVPENDHRDPGRFPIARMFDLAQGKTPVTPDVVQEAATMKIIAAGPAADSPANARGIALVTENGATLLKDEQERYAVNRIMTAKPGEYVLFVELDLYTGAVKRARS